MLMESLLALLLERRVISHADLAQTFDTVLDTKRNFIASDIHPEIAKVAIGVLARLENSLGAAAHVRKADPEASQA